MGVPTAELVIVSLLLLLSLAAILPRRSTVPHAVALVFAGLITGLSSILPGLQVTQELSPPVFLPASTFEGALTSWPGVAGRDAADHSPTDLMQKTLKGG